MQRRCICESFLIGYPLHTPTLVALSYWTCIQSLQPVMMATRTNTCGGQVVSLIAGAHKHREWLLRWGWNDTPRVLIAHHAA